MSSKGFLYIIPYNQLWGVSGVVLCTEGGAVRTSLSLHSLAVPL